MADCSPAALDQVLRKPGELRRVSTLGNERAQIALDIHAVVLPAVIEIPGRFDPRSRIVRIDQRLGKWPPGNIILQCPVRGEAGLIGVLLGRRQIIGVGRVMARGRNVKLDFRKIKLVNIARRQEGAQLLQVSLSQNIALSELGKCGQIRANPLLDIFPSGQTLTLRVDVGCQHDAQHERDQYATHGKSRSAHGFCFLPELLLLPPA